MLTGVAVGVGGRVWVAVCGWVGVLVDGGVGGDQVFPLAMAHGGESEGGTGLRPEYHDHYYGAYFRDPDGYKLCVVCHTPP